MDLSRDRLRAILRYDPGTGIFVRLSGRRAGKVAGSKSEKGYWQIRIENKTLWAHRLAWFMAHGVWPEFVDHISGDRSDNRLSNLRACNRQENARNRKTHSNNRIGMRGVHQQPNGKFCADIWRGRKHIKLGIFETRDAAATARIAATKAEHGDFARLV